MVGGIAVTAVDDAHSRHSVLRERIVEHLFVAATLKRLWYLGIYDAEVLRSEYDGHGYDVFLTRGATTRHIQLKSGVQAQPGRRTVSRSIAKKEGGCVIWLGLDRHSLDLTAFWIFDDFASVSWTKAEVAQANYGRDGGTRKLRADAVVLRRMERLANFDALLVRLLGDEILLSNATNG